MLFTAQGLNGKSRRTLAAAFLVFAVLTIVFTGCVANDDNAMPWATPDPSEGSINLPGYMGR